MAGFKCRKDVVTQAPQAYFLRESKQFFHEF